MTHPFVPGVGAVFSADIAVPSHERVKSFYARMLCTGPAPLWREEDLLNNQGVPIIGLGARTPAYAHLPVQWMPHIQVADVAASVRRAVDLGGSVLMEGKNAAGGMQWAVLADRNGAAFGVIPVVAAGPVAAGTPSAPDTTSRVGRIAWLDLTVPNADAMRDFYREVIGWSAQDVAMRDGDERYADYNMVGDDGNPAAGVCHARGTNEGLAPVWMIYLPVGDLAESLRRVEHDGGTIVKSMRNKEGAYVYAAVRDPVGAHVALVPG